MEVLTFFILGNFLGIFYPCGEICSVFWWLWECVLLEHLGSGASPAPTPPVSTVKVEMQNPRHRGLSLVSHQILWNWLLPRTYCRGRWLISEKLPSVSLLLKILQWAECCGCYPVPSDTSFSPRTSGIWSTVTWDHRTHLNEPIPLNADVPGNSLYWLQIFLQNLMTCQNANTESSTTFSLQTALHFKGCLDFYLFLLMCSDDTSYNKY